MLPLILWTALIVSVILTVRALTLASWWRMWVAAMCSLVISIVTGFTIGPYVIVLTCLQLAGAVALRRAAGPRGWAGLALLGSLIWVVGFPGRVWDGSWLLWLSTFLLATLVVAIGPRRSRADHRFA